MNVRGNCGICRVSILRRSVLRVVPCNHLFHVHCVEQGMLNTPGSLCSMCKAEINGTENVVRRIKKKYSTQDRKRIVVCANKGED